MCVASVHHPTPAEAPEPRHLQQNPHYVGQHALRILGPLHLQGAP